jgi:hypothetical protein
VLQLEHGAAALGADRKGEVNSFAFGRYLDRHHLLEQLDAALHLRGLRRLVPEAVDEHLDAGDLFVLVAFRLAQALEHRVPLLDILAVVPDVVSERPQGQVGDARHHRIKKIAIVRHENDGVRVPGQIAFEPVARVQVEVVGRLVEQKEVGTAEEQLRQRNPHLPST